MAYRTSILMPFGLLSVRSAKRGADNVLRDKTWNEMRSEGK
jgi:hypothetical protein